MFAGLILIVWEHNGVFILSNYCKLLWDPLFSNISRGSDNSGLCRLRERQDPVCSQRLGKFSELWGTFSSSASYNKPERLKGKEGLTFGFQAAPGHHVLVSVCSPPHSPQSCLLGAYLSGTEEQLGKSEEPLRSGAFSLNVRKDTLYIYS